MSGEGIGRCFRTLGDAHIPNCPRTIKPVPLTRPRHGDHQSAGAPVKAGEALVDPKTGAVPIPGGCPPPDVQKGASAALGAHTGGGAPARAVGWPAAGAGGSAASQGPGAAAEAAERKPFPGGGLEALPSSLGPGPGSAGAGEARASMSWMVGSGQVRARHWKRIFDLAAGSAR